MDFAAGLRWWCGRTRALVFVIQYQILVHDDNLFLNEIWILDILDLEFGLWMRTWGFGSDRSPAYCSSWLNEWEWVNHSIPVSNIWKTGGTEMRDDKIQMKGQNSNPITLYFYLVHFLRWKFKPPKPKNSLLLSSTISTLKTQTPETGFKDTKTIPQTENRHHFLARKTNTHQGKLTISQIMHFVTSISHTSSTTWCCSSSETDKQDACHAVGCQKCRRSISLVRDLWHVGKRRANSALRAPAARRPIQRDWIGRLVGNRGV